MSKIVATPSPVSGIMPLLGTTSAFVALVIVGFVGGASAVLTMMM